MSAVKTLHAIEYTDADGVRRSVAANQLVEGIPADELDQLLAMKAVRAFDPLDRDYDGRKGGSKRGRSRKKSPETPEPVEPETADVPELEDSDDGLLG